MNHIVMFSGGLGSYEVAKRVLKKYPSCTSLLFTDTLVESRDTYRFIIETVHYLSGLPGKPRYLLDWVSSLPKEVSEERKNTLEEIRREANYRYPILNWVSQGKTPWEVNFQGSFLSSHRVDLCSRVLKREPSRRFVSQVKNPVVYLGIDWTEIHRFEAAKPRWYPVMVDAPLVRDLGWDKSQTMVDLELVGIQPPEAYGRGMPHNNCLAQGCFKGGIRYWQKFSEEYPEEFSYSVKQEKLWQEAMGKTNTILRSRKGKTTTPLPLSEVRDYGKSEDWGGCGCMLGGDFEVGG